MPVDKPGSWGAIKPRRVGERRQLAKACSKRCFLVPEKLKFPICPKCKKDKCSCMVNCQGALRAYAYACQKRLQAKYPGAAELAWKRARAAGCGWVARKGRPCVPRAKKAAAKAKKELSLAEMREFAKEQGLRGYSRMTKAQLTAALPRHARPASVKELRARAKAAGVRGYSKMRKAELAAAVHGRRPRK